MEKHFFLVSLISSFLKYHTGYWPLTLTDVGPFFSKSSPIFFQRVTQRISRAGWISSLSPTWKYLMDKFVWTKTSLVVLSPPVGNSMARHENTVNSCLNGFQRSLFFLSVISRFLLLPLQEIKRNQIIVSIIGGIP